MKQTGLVLAGGGGKGAYHIGMWKALKEYGIDKKITAVSGTSVGALNALLFANGDYETAEKIWLEIDPDNILKFDAKSIMSAPVIPDVNPVITVSSLLKYFSGGIFSPDGIKKLIKDNIDLEKVSRSGMKIYAGAYNVTKGRMEYLELSGKSPGYILQAVLASSALPVIFPNQKIGSDTYLDGGLQDNVPVKPVYDQGIRNIIACYLERNISYQLRHLKYDSLIQIFPAKSLGNLLTGTLNFSPSSSKKRIKEGYADTVKVLKKTHLY